ncbi:dihydroxyacetone kinase phosphoryl donor subunit DhaM [Cellulomonas marina]|uniref:Phosphocarrier protein HPr n=1 Tax=Cellulomonas marina TaxID=988821 RepID=A0A1I0VD95_9CELL|nr:dihydroxyacetone kinase phosphoryl donor subunit DhaM [Cellulomonas marina]GIG28033.1 PTS sugar transporter subunit IIA [Cellulomonas marina]SFA74301.1 PTS hybrid protein [Cellulomonas marina]
MSGTAGASTPSVALVVVSHSRTLADGVVELAAQMAPGVRLLPAAGAPDGGLGTSFDLVAQALVAGTRDGGHVVVLTDLGSAVLTAESALELAADDVVARVRLVDAPLVEGAVAAAVAAAGGADLEAVARAAAEARGPASGGAGPDAGPDVGPVAGAEDGPDTASAGTAAASVTTPGPDATPAPAAPTDEPLDAQVTVRNELGLHARPAAQLARAMAAFDAQVLVDGANAASVIALMKLGAVGGQTLTVQARGRQAREALDAFTTAVESGFGEV